MPSTIIASNTGGIAVRNPALIRIRILLNALPKHHVHEVDLSLREADRALKFVSDEEFLNPASTGCPGVWILDQSRTVLDLLPTWSRYLTQPSRRFQYDFSNVQHFVRPKFLAEHL
jgi:hypothetical protein